MSQSENRGRPTSCTDKFLQDAKDYVENYDKYGDEFPSIEGMSIETKVCRGMLQDWAGAKTYEESPNIEIFRDIHNVLMAKQGRILKNNGVNGKFNSLITKLMLTKHGYSDKQELTGKDGEPIKTENDNKYTIEIISKKSDIDES